MRLLIEIITAPLVLMVLVLLFGLYGFCCKGQGGCR